MTEKYLSLKWNNHSSVFLKFVKEFQVKEKFCDTTVVCSGKFFPAHRLVLSSCSDYFFEIFDKSDFKHPFIILKDLKPSVFEALLNYMYKGKVSVHQEILPELIEAAEFLKIKGLAVPDDEEEKINIDEKSFVPSKQVVSRTRSQRQKKLIKLDIKEPTFSTNNESNSIGNCDLIFDDEDLSEVVNDIEDDLKLASPKNLKIPSKDKNKRKGKMSSSSKRIKLDSLPVIETVLSSSSYKTTSEYSKCVICNEIIKISNFDAHVHEHYEEGKQIFKRKSASDDKNIDVSTMSETSDETNTTFKCTSCSYETDSKIAYTTHNESHANENIMMCSQCSFSSDYPFDIISHMSIHHKPSSDEVVDNTVDKLLPSNANYHSFRQNGVESYICTLCGYVSNRLNILRKHIRKHDTEKLHSCSLCVFKTVHPSMLEFHLTRIHYGDMTNEIYTCLNCDYLSISNEIIIQHSKLHNDNPDIQNVVFST